MNAPVNANSLPVVQQQENQLFGLVEKVLTSPNPDMAVIEKMLDMQERILAKQAEMAFNRDFAAMAQEIPVIAETSSIDYSDRNGNTRITPYAALETIDAVIRPILSKFGFATSFRVEHPTQASVMVTCVLMHRDGHRETTSMTLNADTSGSKNAVQALGSSVSYGKRYTLSAMLNITTAKEDDNGFAARPFCPLTSEQSQMISGLHSRLDSFRQQLFFEQFGSLENINKSQFAKAQAALNKLIKQGNGNANS